MIYVVCQIWRQTEELCLFCVKSGSRHLILISASEEHVQCVRGVPAHAAEPPRAVCDNLLNVESTPPFFLSGSLSLTFSVCLAPSILALPLLIHRPTVAPENTFAYTSQLQIHESNNEVSDKIHHTQVASHTLMYTLTQK